MWDGSGVEGEWEGGGKGTEGGSISPLLHMSKQRRILMFTMFTVNRAKNWWGWRGSKWNK